MKNSIMETTTKKAPAKPAAKPKCKHLVLDTEAKELFNKAFNLTGEPTEKQAVTSILSRFCELNDLTDVHNPTDVAEIERLKKLTCDKVNCELNAELTQVNSDLTRVNDELKAELTQVKDKLNSLQMELNEAGRKLTEADLSGEKQAAALAASRAETAAARGGLERTFGRLNWLLLKWCAARQAKETGKACTPEQALRLLFEGYIAGRFHVFTKPNGRTIEVFKERIKSERDGAAKKGAEQAE